MPDPATENIPQDLLERSLQLSISARRTMAAILLESIAPEADVKSLLTQRWEDYQSGKTPVIELNEYQIELRRKIAERRG